MFFIFPNCSHKIAFLVKHVTTSAADVFRQHHETVWEFLLIRSNSTTSSDTNTLELVEKSGRNKKIITVNVISFMLWLLCQLHH